jgi:hypothetical protein
MPLYSTAGQENTIRFYPWLSVTSAVKSNSCFSLQECTQLNEMEKKIDAFSSYSNRPSSEPKAIVHHPSVFYSSLFHLFFHLVCTIEV